MRPLAAAVLAFATLPALVAGAAEREVTADEAPVRSAPFDVAPEIARVRAGDRLPADDQPQGIWRRVQLQDGRYGFVRDEDVREAPPVPSRRLRRRRRAHLPRQTSRRAAAAPAVPAPAPVAQVRAPAPRKDTPKPGPDLLSVVFEILPVGTLKATELTGTTRSNRSIDSAFAVAVATALDFAASPYFAIGVSPKVIFRVKSDGVEGVQSSKEYDFRLRLTARAPLSQNTRIYARLSPGYSIISVPEPPANLTSLLLIRRAFSSIRRSASRLLSCRPCSPSSTSATRRVFSRAGSASGIEDLRRQPVPPPRRRLRGRVA